MQPALRKARAMPNAVSSPAAHPTEGFGGKARMLTELQRGGFPVPEFLCSPTNIKEAVERLGFPLVVRSSATAEDGSNSSFAGQFESSLDLWTIDEVERAVERCRRSLSTPGVVDYCRRQGIDPSSLDMHVIVQRMIRPELAGVAFTVNPVTGAEEVVIEACEGLAADLLAGRTTPLPRHHPRVAEHASDVERLARRIQRYFGAPQDIEFAIEAGSLYVLQSRPITRIGFSVDVGEWTNADFRDGGVSSGACTPLMWSLYDFIWERTLKGFLTDIKLLGSDFRAGQMFFGRPYWNLGAVKQCLMKLPGFVEREFDEDLSVAVTYSGDGRRTPVTLRTVIKALPTLLAIDSIWKKQERFDRSFLAVGFDALIRSFETESDDETVLGRLIHETYLTTESNYFRTIYCASLAKLDFKSSYPDADYAALVGGLPPLRHLEPARAMRAMSARHETDVAPLLERFRHHSRRELDIRAPRWDEDREWVERLLSQAPSHEPADAVDTYARARAGALSRLPRRKRRGFERKLDRLRTFVWLREEMRDLSSRAYYTIRRHVLAIARRRGLGDDVFFMTFRDILDGDRSNVERNREIYESYRHFEAPHEIGVRFPFATVVSSRHTNSGSTDVLSGIGVSHGMVTGVAHVARTVEEAVNLKRGDVLVCVFTDPGWTAVLDRAAAVVTESGGLLSHAAVICREYGVPAVLGVPDATRRIENGRTVLVDGSHGVVQLR